MRILIAGCGYVGCALGERLAAASHEVWGLRRRVGMLPEGIEPIEADLAVPATLRELPLGITVWEAACLNCHDTHTVHGARRLAREGTDSTASPKSGGNSAIEETCYQCHTASPAVNNPSAEVKDIDLHLSFESDLPSVVLSDPTRVRQILVNLTGNAIKFTSEGSVRLAVTYQPSHNDAGVLQVAVEDDHEFILFIVAMKRRSEPSRSHELDGGHRAGLPRADLHGR